MVCKDCIRLAEQVKTLTQEVEALKAENKELRNKIEEFTSSAEAKEKPTFVKEDVKRRQKRPGAKPGHTGYARPLPGTVEEEIELSLETRPICGGELSGEGEIRERFVEDIDLKRPSKVTKYITHRRYCKRCGKIVSSMPRDVLPGCRFGINLGLFVCYQKYGLRLPYNKIKEELETYFGLKITEGGLVNIIQGIAKRFGQEFESLKKELRGLAVVHGDETGWRINGKNHWLWAFIGEKVAVFEVNKSRGKKVPKRVLGKKRKRTVVSDCWSSYDSLTGEKQKCWVHLIRDVRKFATCKKATDEAKLLYKKVKRLYKDSVGFVESMPPPAERERRKKHLLKRVDKLYSCEWTDPNCRKFVKRLAKHRNALFTFVVNPEVKSHNNDAERAIRPNVVIRKISGGNRSVAGAAAHETMMSVMYSWQLQGKSFMEEGAKYLQSQLPLAE